MIQPLSVESLYAAQKAGLAAVTSHLFSRLDASQSSTFGGHTWIVVRNAVHDCLSAISSILYYIAEKTESLALWILQALSDTLAWCIKKTTGYEYSLINTLYPLNLIDGKHHFTFFPRQIEKLFGDLASLCTGLTVSDPGTIQINGIETSVQDYLDGIKKSLLDSNIELVNPTNLSPTEKFEYDIRVSSMPTLNAFSMPGGRIIVFKYLVEKIAASVGSGRIKDTIIRLQDGSLIKIDLSGVTLDDIIAALLAHEITHAASRHGAFAITLDIIIEFLADFLPESVRDWVYISLISLYRSRSNEYEADIAGAFLSKQAQFDPRGQLYLQAYFKEHSDLFALQFFELTEFAWSHPCTNSRLVALLAGISSFDPSSITNHVIEWKAPTEKSPYDPKYLSPALSIAKNFHRILPHNKRLEEGKSIELSPKDQLVCWNRLFGRYISLKSYSDG